MAASSSSSNTILTGDVVSWHVFFTPQVQDKLLLSACHLLVSLATTVRPVFLISIPAVQKVFNRITDASSQRLVDKVRPQGSPGIPRAVRLRLRGWGRRIYPFVLYLELTGPASVHGFLTCMTLMHTVLSCYDLPSQHGQHADSDIKSSSRQAWWLCCFESWQFAWCWESPLCILCGLKESAFIVKCLFS